MAEPIPTTTEGANEHAEGRTYSFAQILDFSASIAKASLLVDTSVLTAAIEQAEKALDSGVIDPVDIATNAPTLRHQLEFMRVFRDFRAALEPFATEEVVA